VSVSFDEPRCVVEFGPSSDSLAEVVDGVVEIGPEALLFQGADEPFGTAVGFGFADEGGIVCDSEPCDGADEVPGPVLGSLVVS
jgi:hypothetical protein